MKTKNTKSTALFIALLICTVNVSATWWDTDWSYKKPLEIDSASALTDYQMAINISYDSDMQTDFDDLRFTNEEEDTELDYWIESKSNGEWAYVWVEIDSIDTQNGTQAYVYYGNQSASSLSNGKNTFQMWTGLGDSSSWTANGYTLEDDDSSLYIHGSVAGGQAEISMNSSDSSYIVESKTRISEPGYAATMMFLDSSGGTSKIYFWRSKNNDKAAEYYTTPLWTYVSLYDGLSYSRYYINKFIIDETADKVDYYLYNASRNNLLASAIDKDLREATTGINYFSVHDGSGSSYQLDFWIKWLFVRKYTATEPSYSIGTEGSSNQAPSDPSPSITPSTVYTNTDIVCTATYVDSDGDDGTLNFTLLVEGALKNTCSYPVGNNTEKTCNLSSGNYSKNQVINCTVTATDNNYQSIVSSVTKTVQNSIPTTPTALTPSSGTYTTSVTINCSGSTDSDPSDTVLYDIETNRTGSWVILEDDGDGYYIWVTSSYTQNSVDLRCRATDSTDNSKYHNPAGAINIDNTAPAINLNTTSADYNTVLDRVWAYIAIYSDSTLNACLLDWNGTNNSIDKSGTMCSENKTSLAVGNYTFTGWVNDSIGNWNHTGEYWVYINATTTTTSTTLSSTGGAGGWGSGTPNVATVIKEPTCTDGIQNQGEEQVDCGGPCSSCEKSTTTTKATTTTTTIKTATTVKKATATTMTTTTTTEAPITAIKTTSTTISAGGGVALATTGIVVLAFVLFAGIVVYLMRMK